MKNKVKAKVLIHVSEYKRRVDDFEEWLDDNVAMKQLREMDAKNVVGIMKEVWEEIKGGF